MWRVNGKCATVTSTRSLVTFSWCFVIHIPAVKSAGKAAVSPDLKRNMLKRRIGDAFTATVNSYLHFWARLVLRRRRPCIVGVTGSVGKTTTKDYIAAVLMDPDAKPFVGLVWKTPGNMNNTMGLPLAVMGYQRFPTSRRHVFGLLAHVPLRAAWLATVAQYPNVIVLEYSAGPLGNLPRLARLARPTVAIVTAVGPSHLETFGTVEEVARVKGALAAAAPADGLVVLGADTPYSAELDRVCVAPVHKIAGKGRALSTDVARTVARYFHLPDGIAERVLEQASATTGRLQTMTLDSLTVINDSFNANPLSMKLGLDTLATISMPGRRRVAILGDMAELGDGGPDYHREIAAYARGRADVVVGVGALARHYAADYWFPDSDKCAAGIDDVIRSGDCVLVKGSHAIRLGRVVRRLEAIAPTLVDDRDLH
jgi:UDP-N-acetylmuramoyl-tripeptide--D-alanyl-D-alanine ligase